MRLIILLALLFATQLQAAPGDVYRNVAMDVEDGVTHCGVFVDGGAKTIIPASGAVGTNGCVYNLAALPNGNHSMEATAIIEATQSNTGGESLRSSPFPFVKQGQPTAPSIRLSQ